MASRRTENTILHHDCLKAMAALPEGCVDLAFADPPFNIGYEYDVYDDKQERDAYLAWSAKWIAAVHRVLKPTGTFWLAIGDEYAAELKLIAQNEITAGEAGLASPRSRASGWGFHCRSWVVWYYTFGVNCKYKFSRSHAHLFHFVKDPKQFTFNEKAIRVPSARQLVYADGRANPAGRLPDDTWILRPQDLPDGFTPDEDTWYFPRVAGTFKERAGFHGCQMPEQLLGRIIRACSNPGELVLDPFSGSATTLAVSKKLGRRWLGFDLSKEYVQSGTARLERIRESDPLDGAPEPLVSVPATAKGRRLASPTSGPNCAPRGVENTITPSLNGSQEREREWQEIVLQSYLRVHDGFSSDYVIANPELNAAFVDMCKTLGSSLLPRDANQLLLRLRKSRKLRVHATRRVMLGRQHTERFVFASEIALRKMHDRGHSLDEVLCDPVLADEFDRIAQRYAPGFRGFDYRWGALKVRKAHSDRMDALPNLDAAQKRRKASPAVMATELDRRRIPTLPGVYRVWTREGQELYVGETDDLNERLACQFDPQRLLEYGNSAEELLLCVIPTGRSQVQKTGLQAYWIDKREPTLNFVLAHTSQSA